MNLDAMWIENNEQQLQIKKLTNTATTPTSAHNDDIGYDLYADKTYNIMPGMSAKISTGIALAQPKDYWIKFFDRSSRAFPDKEDYSSCSLVVLGGVIDNYRGEIFVILHNLSQGNETDTIRINPGDKIAQMVLLPFNKLPVVVVKELPSSQRGDKGFGSSGK